MHSIIKSESDLYDLWLETIDSHVMSMNDYKGQVLLIINVASRCGFTPQYEALEKMYQAYRERGFTILAFPCNQFRHQEPGSNQEIDDYAKSCFRVTFPLFAKIDVKGQHQSPLYAYLAAHLRKKPLMFVPWNFTKILVSREGDILQQFLPFTSMKRVRASIEKCLNTPPPMMTIDPAEEN